jgi:5-formyltetrahydrofolate cyclo-ligase
MDDTKATIRQEMRRRRRALSAAELAAVERSVAAYAAALEQFRTARCVLAYIATDGEVPTGALLETAFAAGKRVYLPRLAGETIRFAEHRRGGTLHIGERGIPEPLGALIAAHELVSSVAFVPLLAWDATGRRVGRGGGHYDRTVSGPARPMSLVGLGYTFQQYAALPCDPWDLRLDWVVTERGAVRCRSGEDPSPLRKEDATHHGIRRDGAGRRRAGGRAGLAGGLPPAPTS